MTDYISREAAEKTLIEYFRCSLISESFIKAVVEQIPAADVRLVVHGEWEYISFMTCRCSVCKEVFHELAGDNFCPTCGADMRAANDRPYGGTDSSAPLGMTTGGADGRVPSLRNDKEDEWKQSE